jgi:hypothetical protein
MEWQGEITEDTVIELTPLGLLGDELNSIVKGTLRAKSGEGTTGAIVLDGDTLIWATVAKNDDPEGEDR